MYWDVNDYIACCVSSGLLQHKRIGKFTAGVARRRGGSGGCRKGDVGREGLSGFAAA